MENSKLEVFIDKHSKKISIFFIFLFLLVGLINLLVHINVPNVRNSLIYGRIIYNIKDLGQGFSAAADAFNKPLGFVYLSYPLVKWWGSDIGLKLSSFFITILWSLSLIPFFNHFSDRFGVENKKRWLFIFLIFFNPLVIYQFMSAYPDMFFALGFLWSILVLDRGLSKKVKWFDGLLFSFFFLFSVWIKHNGFVIVPVLLIFMYSRRKHVKWLWQNRRHEIILGGISLLFVLSILISAQLGYDFDLFNLGHNTSNYTGGEDRVEILTTNIGYAGVFLISTFSVFSLFILFWPRFWKNREIYFALIIYIAALLYYKGTWYNLRYYITIMPFLVLIIISNFQRLNIYLRRLVLLIFFVTNFYTIFYYNSLEFHNTAKKVVNLPITDNFRLVRDQKEAKEKIEKVNKLVEEDGYNNMIFVSPYVDNSVWYVWERDGLFSEKLDIKYKSVWKDEYLEGKDDSVIIDWQYKSVDKFLLWKEEEDI